MAQSARIVMPTIRPQLMLNRMGEKRGDRAWLEALRGSAEARYVLLADLKLAVVSNAERTETRLRTLPGGEVLDCGVQLRDALFLGLGEDGAPWFAAPFVSGQSGLTLEAAGRYAPFVDMRSLALQGAMPGEELAIAGQARALAA